MDREQAMDLLDNLIGMIEDNQDNDYDAAFRMAIDALRQPEQPIPLSWIEEHIEWLKSLDNEFANLAAAHISVMVKKWRDEQDETD